MFIWLDLVLVREETQCADGPVQLYTQLAEPGAF